MKIWTIALLLYLPFFLCYSQRPREKPLVAIFELKANGVPTSYAQEATQRLQTSLFNTNVFRLLSRSEIDKVLEEHAMQQSGVVDEKNAIKAAQFLNAEKVIAGHVGKQAIDIILTNVITAEIEKAFKRDYDGSLKDLLLKIEEISLDILPAREGISEIPLYVAGGVAIGSAIFTGISIYNSSSNYQKYKDATTGENVVKYKDNTEKSNQLAITFGIITGVSTLFYFIYDHYYEKSKMPENFYAFPVIKNNQTYGLVINYKF